MLAKIQISFAADSPWGARSGCDVSFRKPAPAAESCAGRRGCDACGAGCAPSALTSARAQDEGAHDAGASTVPACRAFGASRKKIFSAAQLREVKDDLCITDFTIGAPPHSRSLQQQQHAPWCSRSRESTAESFLDRRQIFVIA